MDLSQSMVELKANQVLCLEGDQNSDLFIIHSGKLLVCVRKRSEITPLATLEAGEYFGELSFFDQGVRSADVIAMEDCVLVRIPQEELARQFPQWLVTIGQSMTKRLRLADEVVRAHGIKRKNTKAMQPLAMEEQGRYFRLLKEHAKSLGKKLK